MFPSASCSCSRHHRRKPHKLPTAATVTTFFMRNTAPRRLFPPYRMVGAAVRVVTVCLMGGRKRLLVSENHPLSHFAANKVRVTGITLLAISCWWQRWDAFVVLCLALWWCWCRPGWKQYLCDAVIAAPRMPVGCNYL